MSEVKSPIVLNSTMEVGIKNICNKLESVAVAIGKSVIETTWEHIQQIVEAGIAPESYPVGTQFTVHHDTYGDIIWDVVAHNYNTDSNGDVIPSMTLLAHDRIADLQYDAPEAMYYCEDELPIGTYNFIYNSKTYQFTTTAVVPAGGQLRITWEWWGGKEFTTGSIVGYSSPTSTTQLFSVSYAEGSEGTYLGTHGDANINHFQRTSYGSNNWAQSAMRQFLNSDAAAGNVWTAQTKFDRAPSWVNSVAGFMKGLPEDFLKVVGDTKIFQNTNSVYETGDYTKNQKYSTIDKFWLASRKEIFGTSEGVDDGTIQFPYYVDSTDADRVKTKVGTTTASYWWLRSPYVDYAFNVRSVTPSGSLGSGHAYYTISAVPACVIY